MNTAQIAPLDGVLETLVQQYGYPQVLDHLVRVGGQQGRMAETPTRLTARQMLALPMEERDRILAASVEAALPAYEADGALPPHRRELTIDLETGDGLDDEEDAQQETSRHG